jgi:cytochrome c551/c552
MKKALMGLSMVALMAGANAALAGDTFKAKCGACHNGSTAPSAAQIQEHYKGKKADLAAFLDGKGTAGVKGFADNAGKVALMKGQLGGVVKGLSAADRAAIEAQLSE